MASSENVEFQQLFDKIQSNFAKSSQLRGERWYIVVLACLAASPDPEAAAQLYLHLINKPEYAASEARKELVRRLREALFKSVIIVGVCKPLEAILAISEVEREEDRDYTFTRKEWKSDEENTRRGMEWFSKLYARNATNTLGFFDAHVDFAWVSKDITYGLFLSDRQVLDDIDTEMVVLPAIMMQNLKRETHWHIRGTRRIGVSQEDVQIIWDSIQEIAAHFGLKLTKVPTVADVEPEV